MDEKKYTINGEPVSARELINEARSLDEDFDQSGFYFTSEAAEICRRHGQKVGALNE